MRLFLAIFCLSLVWQQGCQRGVSKKKESSSRILEVTISKTPCRGKCPSYTARLSEKTVHLEAHAHMAFSGVRKGVMTEAMWNRISEFLTSSDYQELPSEDYSNATDVSSLHWIIKHEGGSKEISYDMRSEHVFQDLEKELEAWYEVVLQEE